MRHFSSSLQAFGSQMLGRDSAGYRQGKGLDFNICNNSFSVTVGFRLLSIRFSVCRRTTQYSKKSFCTKWNLRITLPSCRTLVSLFYSVSEEDVLFRREWWQSSPCILNNWLVHGGRDLRPAICSTATLYTRYTKWGAVVRSHGQFMSSTNLRNKPVN